MIALKTKKLHILAQEQPYEPRNKTSPNLIKLTLIRVVPAFTKVSVYY